MALSNAAWALVGAVVLGIGGIVVLVRRLYRRSPPGQALVIWGQVRSREPARVIEGTAFVLPVLQTCGTLSLAPFEVEVVVPPDAGGRALSFRVYAAVGDVPHLRLRAATYLMDLDDKRLRTLVKVIAGGEARLVTANLDAEALRQQRAAVHRALHEAMAPPLARFGLVIREVRLD